jgi:hypothetical protein
VFPVSLISLIMVLRLRLGGLVAARVAQNALAPMLGFGAMLLTLHVSVRPLGLAAGFTLALLISVAWSGAILLMATPGRTRIAGK